MRFLRHLVVSLAILALLFSVVGAGLASAAYGSWAYANPGQGVLPLAVGHALAVILGGGLIVLAMPVVANAIAQAEDRRRYGALAFAAAVPDLAIAWSYLAALVAPALIGTDRNVMAALLVVEFLAAYSTIMIVSLSQLESGNARHPAVMGAKLAVIVVTLSFVIAGSVWAKSWLPIGGYLALTGKRIVMGLLEPEHTAASLSEHQYHRCMVPVAVLVFIGAPLFLLSKSLETLLVLGALNFAFMAILEMVLHAPKRRVN